MGYSRTVPVYLLLMIALAACQSTGLAAQNPEETQAGAPAVSPVSTQEQSSTPLLTPEDTVMDAPITPDAAAQKMVDLAKHYLAQRLNIAVEQITLVEVKQAIWRDASLGCPKPAVDYIRVETPGFRVVLETGGKMYNLHTDQVKRVVLCAAS